MEKKTVQIPKELHDKLRDITRKSGDKIQTFVCRSIEQKLARETAKKK